MSRILLRCFVVDGCRGIRIFGAFAGILKNVFYVLQGPSDVDICKMAKYQVITKTKSAKIVVLLDQVGRSPPAALNRVEALAINRKTIISMTQRRKT
jgi:hypothetical protein